MSEQNDVTTVDRDGIVIPCPNCHNEYTHENWCSEIQSLRQQVADLTRERDEARAKVAAADASRCY